MLIYFLNPFQRLLVQAICLTGSDLNSSSKPWDVQENTTQVVYDEFHEQVNKRTIALE